VAIVLGVAIVVAAVTGALVTPWIVIGASLLGMIWLAVAKRRPPGAWKRASKPNEIAAEAREARYEAEQDIARYGGGFRGSPMRHRVQGGLDST